MAATARMITGAAPASPTSPRRPKRVCRAARRVGATSSVGVGGCSWRPGGTGGVAAARTGGGAGAGGSVGGRGAVASASISDVGPAVASSLRASAATVGSCVRHVASRRLVASGCASLALGAGSGGWFACPISSVISWPRRTAALACGMWSTTRPWSAGSVTSTGSIAGRSSRARNRSIAVVAGRPERSSRSISRRAVAAVMPVKHASHRFATTFFATRVAAGRRPLGDAGLERGGAVGAPSVPRFRSPPWRRWCSARVQLT